MDEKIEYTPIFYTDTSAFDYFNVFFTNFIFVPDIINIKYMCMTIFVLSMLILIWYKWTFAFELKLQASLKKDIEPSVYDINRLDELRPLFSAPFPTFTCNGGILSSSEGYEFVIGSDCDAFIVNINQTM